MYYTLNRVRVYIVARFAGKRKKGNKKRSFSGRHRGASAVDRRCNNILLLLLLLLRSTCASRIL